MQKQLLLTDVFVFGALDKCTVIINFPDNESRENFLSARRRLLAAKADIIMYSEYRQTLELQTESGDWYEFSLILTKKLTYDVYTIRKLA